MDLDDILLNPQLPPEAVALLVHRVRTVETELAASRRRESELEALVCERNMTVDFLQGHVNQLRLQLALAGIGVDMRSAPPPSAVTNDNSGSGECDSPSAGIRGLSSNVDGDDGAAAAATSGAVFGGDDDEMNRQLYQDLCGLCVSGDRSEQLAGNAVRQGRRGSLGRLSSISQQGQPQPQQQTASGSPFSAPLSTSPMLRSANNANGATTPVRLHFPASARYSSAPVTPQLMSASGGGAAGFGELPPPPCHFVQHASSSSARTTPGSVAGGAGSPFASFNGHRERVILGAGSHHPDVTRAIAKSGSGGSKAAAHGGPLIPIPPHQHANGGAAPAEAAPRNPERGSREFKRHRAESEEDQQ